MKKKDPPSIIESLELVRYPGIMILKMTTVTPLLLFQKQDFAGLLSSRLTFFRIRRRPVCFAILLPSSSVGRP